jgi:type IV fimbrial biogenesis protein FimT
MRGYKKGFTIIELMVTLAVLAIVLGIAIPSFNSQIQRNGSLGLGEEFISALNFARTEAIKRRAPVSICASNADVDACDGTDWSNGWIIFVDEEQPETSSDIDPKETLRQWNDIDPRAAMTVTRNANAISFIRFNARGALARIEDFSVIAQAKFTGCSGEAARQITIGLSGMTSSKTIAC